MKRLLQLCLLASLVLVLTSSTILAQAPVGTVSGTVTDETGAVIPNANVVVKNKETNIERQINSGADGRFSAPALPAGQYEIRVEVKGFRTVVREATVEVGLITTADLRLPVGQTNEVVNVEAATAQIEYEKNSIDGVVGRNKIEGLPLNGRSYMQLASAEPGVRINTSGTSQYNSQFSVSVLGGDAGKTAISVDGGPVRDRIEGSGSSMNFSQEVVQEFQLSEVNFDLSTDITSVGSINIVTRSGGNDFHGSGYFFFRDHNMAAYPGLRRTAPADPFFARRNPGFWLGGPIKKEKAFFFFNYEYQNQLQAVTVQPDLPSLAPLAGSFGSPYTGKTLSVRFDYRLSSKHNLFLRYSHDGNQAFGPAGNTPVAPSAWLRNVNWADQATFGVTSTLSATLVNDFRFSYNFWSNRNLFPNSSDCATCVGLGFAGLSFQGSSLGTLVGDNINATQGRDLRDFTWTDNVTWQKGSHRIRFGGEVGLQPGTGFWGYCDPGCFGVFTPEYLTGILGAANVAKFFPNMPKTIGSNADILNLPFAVGGVIGVGDPSQPPLYNIDTAKSNNRYRIYGSDTWKLKPNFTVNFGLAYEYESNLFNQDLSKPAYLAPIYGSDLSPTNPNHGNISPAIGFAWNVGKDNKTVIRGGAGIYYDTEYLYRRLQERSVIGPVGNGRTQFPTTNIINTFPGVINLANGSVVGVGSPLPASSILTLTLGQFMQLYNAQIGAITASLAPKNLNDLSVRNINIAKSGAQLLPLDYPVQHSYHTSIGVQRQLRHDLVINADYVRRVFLDVLYDGNPIDLNNFNRFTNGVQTPVIPVCAGAQRSDPSAQCSTGPITFWQPGQRNRYQALLVKADKRFANRFQFTASYALADQVGVNGIYDLTNYNSSYGPQGSRHTIGIIGMVDLPWGFQLGLITTIASRAPVMPIISGIEINGQSGITSTPLPGLAFNCLNRGCGQSDLAAAVTSFNSTYAGKKDATGKTIPTLTLPSKYELGEGVNSEDVRLTKLFTLKERYKFSVFAEMFNVFNVSNLSGFNFNVNSGTFGVPTQRAGQVFGSAGPRALQVGGRFSF
jgi:hypothetical protein